MFLVFSESFPYCYFLRFQNRGWQRCLHKGASRQPQGPLCPPSIALTHTKGCSEIRRKKCIRRCHVKFDEIIKNGATKAALILSLFFFQGGINQSIHKAKRHGETRLLFGTTDETDKWQRQGKKQGSSRLRATCSLVVYHSILTWRISRYRWDRIVSMTPDSLYVGSSDRKRRIADVEAIPNPPGTVSFPAGPDQPLRKKHEKPHWKLSKSVS